MLIYILSAFIVSVLCIGLIFFYVKYSRVQTELKNFKVSNTIIGVVGKFTQDDEDYIAEHKDVADKYIKLLDYTIALEASSLHDGTSGMSDSEIRFRLGKVESLVMLRGKFKQLYARQRVQK